MWTYRIVSGKFTAHSLTNNGVKIPLKFEDCPAPNPLNSLDDLKKSLQSFMNAIDLPERNRPLPADEII